MMNKIILTMLLTSAAAQAMQPGFNDGNSPQRVDRSQCVISAGSGMVDYGVMSRWQLRETGRGGELTPGLRNLSVTVACPYTQDFRLKITAESSVAGQVRYGNSGWLKLRVSNLRVDGRATGIVVTSPNQGTREAASGSAEVSDGSLFSPRTDEQNVTGRSVTFDLALEPRLTESDTRVSAPNKSEAGLRITLE